MLGQEMRTMACWGGQQEGRHTRAGQHKGAGDMEDGVPGWAMTRTTRQGGRQQGRHAGVGNEEVCVPGWVTRRRLHSRVDVKRKMVVELVVM